MTSRKRYLGNNTHIGRCLGAVADIANYVKLGDETMARASRRTLNHLCLGDGPDGGYPVVVRLALRQARLRETD
jgi:hypothetical protein